TELEIGRWEELIRGFTDLSVVRVIVSNASVTAELEGQFGGFSTAGHFFNVQTATLDMHILWEELGAAFAVEKPGHLDGINPLSFQFYDRTGAAALKVFLNFGEAVSNERTKAFAKLRDRFQAKQGLNCEEGQ